MKIHRLTFVLALLALGGLWAAEDSPPSSLVPYPEGFRSWRHLGSVVSHPKDKPDAPAGLIHHIYANEKAVEGYRTGVFPEGAMFVADWYVLKEKYPGGFDEGDRDRTDVMIKDARFAATGGWGFDQFAKDSREVRNVGPVAPNACFNCHTKVKARDHVFSALRP